MTADELARLAEGATKGPTSVHRGTVEDHPAYTSGVTRPTGIGGDVIADYFTEADAELDAALRNSLPEILAAMRVAEAAKVLSNDPVFKGSVALRDIDAALDALKSAAHGGAK